MGHRITISNGGKVHIYKCIIAIKKKAKNKKYIPKLSCYSDSEKYSLT